MILTYYGYLNEGRGISNWIKRFSSIVCGKIIGGERYFSINVENLEEIKEIGTINFVVISISNDYSAKFLSNGEDLKDDITISIDLPPQINPYYLHEVIVHELTHLWEYYKIKINGKSFPLYDKVKKTLIRTIDQDRFDPFIYFRNLVYLTLDNEMNARVSQLYQNLFFKKDKSYTSLINHFKMSKTWKKIIEIENFNAKTFSVNLLEILGDNLTYRLINDFNEELSENGVKYKFNKEVSSKEQVIEYFTNWQTYFKRKSVKQRKKVYKILSEVSDDYKDNI